MSVCFFVLFCCVLWFWNELDFEWSFLHISTITDNITNNMTGKQTPRTMAVVSLAAKLCDSGERFELGEVWCVVELEDIVVEVGSLVVNDEFVEPLKVWVSIDDVVFLSGVWIDNGEVCCMVWFSDVLSLLIVVVFIDAVGWKLEIIAEMFVKSDDKITDVEVSDDNEDDVDNEVGFSGVDFVAFTVNECVRVGVWVLPSDGVFVDEWDGESVIDFEAISDDTGVKEFVVVCGTWVNGTNDDLSGDEKVLVGFVWNKFTVDDPAVEWWVDLVSVGVVKDVRVDDHGDEVSMCEGTDDDRVDKPCVVLGLDDVPTCDVKFFNSVVRFGEVFSISGVKDNEDIFWTVVLEFIAAVVSKGLNVVGSAVVVVVVVVVSGVVVNIP